MRLGALGAALAVPAAGAVLAGAGSAAALTLAAAPCGAATFTSHVTLVVEHGDASVIGLCIGFDGATITGEQILQASGLHFATQSYGALGDAVCQIDGEPVSYGACLPAGGDFWAMDVSRGGGAWQTADRGISSEPFGDGDAEGFRYESQGGPEPPPASPAGICARALATPPPPPAASGRAPPASGGTGAPPGSASVAPVSGRPAAPSTAAPAPAAAAAATATASPVPVVINPDAPRAPGGVATTGLHQAGAAPGLNIGLLLASVTGCALLGLLVLQAVRRRRSA